MRLVVALDVRRRTVPTTMFGEAPLLIRVTEADVGSGLQVHLVGGAAGPLGGDRLQTSVDIGAGSRLAVRSVAASLAQPGRAGAPGSTGAVVAVVGAGADLEWWPEPLISVRGSQHTQTTTVDVADETATVRWVDEVVLGRHEEPGGRLTVHQRFTVGGRPVLRHTVTFDPATDGIGRNGTARVAVTAIVSGSPSRVSESVVEPGMRAVRYPLSPMCTAWIALADDLDTARATLAGLGLARRDGAGGPRPAAIGRVETSA